MKKSNTVIAVGKDIKIHNNRFSLEKTAMLEFLSVLLFTFGAMSTLNNAIGVTYNLSVMLIIATFSALFTFIYKLKRFAFIAVFGVLLSFVGIIIAYIRPFTLAVYYLNEQFIAKINRLFGLNYGYYIANMTADDRSNVIFLIPIVLAFILCFVVASITINRRMTVIMLLISIVFLYLEFFLTVNVNVINILLITLGFAINFALKTSLVNLSPYNKPIVSYKDVYSNHYVVSDAKSCTTNIGVIVLVICLVFSAITIPLISTSKTDTATKNIEAKRHFTKIIDYFSSYSSMDRSGFWGVGGSDTAFGGIAGDQKLGQVKNISFSGAVHATVGGDISLPLYLKGYVGEVYSDNRWTKKTDTPQEKQMLANYTQLLTPPFFASPFTNFLYSYALDDSLPYNDINTLNINIINKQTKYLLQPYFLNSLPIAEGYQNDDDIQLNGLSNYTTSSFVYNKFGTDIETWYLEDLIYYKNNYYSDFKVAMQNMTYYSDQESTNSLLAALNDYSNYAYSAYTALPENADNYLYAATGSLPRLITAYEKAEAVKFYLTQNMKYTVSPGKTPVSKDFAEYFLTTSKKGYCTHFATAGVLMLRYLGVPTRYVEGYAVFTPKNFDVNTGILDVTDDNAHAWVEIYEPDLGWVPFDMTPTSDSDVVSSDVSSELTSSEPINSEASSELIGSENVSSTASIQLSSAPPVSNDVSSGTPVSPNFTPSKTFTWVTLVVIAVLSLAGLIILTLLMLRRYRKLMFTQPNRNKAVIEIYRRIQKLTSKKKVACGNDIHDYAKNVVQTLAIEDFAEITDIVLKAKFSQHTITEDEYLQVLSCLECFE